jgi:hypothetical protein
MTSGTFAFRHLGVLSQRLDRLCTLLEPKDKSTNAVGENAGWLERIEERLHEIAGKVQHAHKCSMIFGGIALVLAAVGTSLLVSRLSASPTDPTAGVSTITPTTLKTLCFTTAGSLLLTWVIAVRHAIREWHGVFPISAIGFGALGGILWLTAAQGSGAGGAFRLGHGTFGAGLLSTALGLLMIAVYYARRGRRLEQDLDDLQFERDLQRHEVNPFQTRAEKLLSVNQVQLRRYYELNLQQARAVFVVGIGCIIAGLGVVGFTLWFLASVRDNEFTQGMVTLIGAIGTVLTNFVAYMYFKLHGSISDSLMTFHRQLAAIHDLFFANVLATSVPSDEVRSHTLVQLSQAIAARRMSELSEVQRNSDGEK